jgi:hypothetical protein
VESPVADAAKASARFLSVCRTVSLPIESTTSSATNLSANIRLAGARFDHINVPGFFVRREEIGVGAVRQQRRSLVVIRRGTRHERSSGGSQCAAPAGHGPILAHEKKRIAVERTPELPVDESKQVGRESFVVVPPKEMVELAHVRTRTTPFMRKNWTAGYRLHFFLTGTHLWII